MRFMNDWDIERALDRFDPYTTPNRAKAARVLDSLRVWTDHNSDGWPYWPKPAWAAAKVMDLLEGDGTWPEQQRLEREDATDAELSVALRPIKSFLTRQGVNHEQVL